SFSLSGFTRPSSLSPAVFPRRLRYGQRSHLVPAFGLLLPQDHHRMIPIRIHDPLDLAFDVRGQVRQHGCSSPSFHEGFAVYRSTRRFGWREEPPGDLLLSVAHDMEHSGPAFGQTSKDVAFPADRHHDQRRLEGRLRDQLTVAAP